MKFGTGLPGEVRGVTGEILIEWMARADDRPFSTLAVTDEIVSPTCDGLTTLAAAAAVTRRVRLMSTVIVGPLRNTAILAKQAASIDMLSSGRLSLGLGVGDPGDDFPAVGVEVRGRGKRFDDQLTMMKQIWAGEPMGESGRAIGPAPVQAGGPELLLGGFAPRAMERIGRLADGLAGAVLSEEMISDEPYRIAEQSWREHKRPGKPRFVQNVYYALGANLDDAFDAFLAAAFAGAPAYDLQAIRDVTPRTDSEVRRMIERIESTGADELIFHPVSADIDQLSRLEQSIG